MKSNLNHQTDHRAIDPILGNEEELIPSSGFLAATMERVRDEAAIPKPIPFPWLRALPGIGIAAAALCWCGFELAHLGLASSREVSFTDLHMAAATGRALEPAGWVAVALAVSLVSWLFARRLAGRSGLL
ncbi:MAG: hypothetical protein ACLP07_11580 [Terracidiphilus sp.]